MFVSLVEARNVVDSLLECERMKEQEKDKEKVEDKQKAQEKAEEKTEEEKGAGGED